MSDGLISLDARNIAGTWWIGKLGRAVANSEADCVTALKSAVRSSDPGRPVNIFWASPPDSSIPNTWHSGDIIQPKVRDVLAA
jgi:hypothetical protein